MLLGDAAHSIFPFYGQGLNASLDDCRKLVEIIKRNKSDFQKTGQEFQMMQKKEADSISELSRLNFYDLQNNVQDAEFIQMTHTINKVAE